ncbi:MAG: carbon storage regulator CsrA [Atribacterota bacterium]|jgi:carbon storage regulator|nr:carbon storage regulator CsrA [Atribacterota bacterium]
MLVVTRRIDQSIRIGNNIEIKILGIEKGKVKVGVSAPPDIPVYREELYQSLVQDNQKALFVSEEMVPTLRKVFSPPESAD